MSTVRLAVLVIETLLILMLAGCGVQGSGLSGMDTGILQTPQEEAAALAPGTIPGGTAQQVSTATPEPALLPSSIPTQTPQPAAVALTPTVESTAMRICSPLLIHPLEELPEIISDLYRPPPPGKEQRHHGVDFSYYRRGERLSIQGVGVQNVLPGVVSTALAETFPYGNIVIIETPYADLPDVWVEALHIPAGYSIYTLYAHMERAPGVVQGEQLDACQPLGEVGISGNAVEPHLHLEMRLGAPGARFDSLGFYKADDTEEERSNYLRWRTSGVFQHFDPMLILGGSSGENGVERQP